MNLLKTRRLAVAIGINEYLDPAIPDLYNPIHDVTAITQVLKLKYNFDEFELLATPDRTNKKYLYNYLKDIFINALPEDTILVIFAGHGSLNPITNTTFWKPSDSDASDESSWLNLADIISFISASKAKHIAIISDSCFSGGIFDIRSRGGGIDAFDFKKSREALASGSKEKVSDGKKGEHSPFAESLITILNTNTEKELLFNFLSIQLIKIFNPTIKQTPTTGSLTNTGHDGGSLVFELMEPGPNNNIYQVKELMGSFYINIDPQFEDKMETLRNYAIEKNKAVKSQQYLKAADLRDEEIKFIDDILNELNAKLDSIEQEVIMDIKYKVPIDELENEAKIFNSRMKRFREEKMSQYVKLASEEDSISEEIDSSIGIPINETTPLEYSSRNNPIVKKFSNSKDRYFNYYKEGIGMLYLGFVRDFIGIDSKYVMEKYTILVNVLIEAYKTQIILASSNLYSEIRRDKTIAELRYKILTWLD